MTRRSTNQARGVGGFYLAPGGQPPSVGFHRLWYNDEGAARLGPFYADVFGLRFAQVASGVYSRPAALSGNPHARRPGAFRHRRPICHPGDRPQQPGAPAVFPAWA